MAMNQLGDIICTSSACSEGEANVKQMVATFNTLNQPSNFAPTVSSIKASFDDINPTIKIFNQDCCALRDLGKQARDVTNTMLVAAGQAPIKDDTSASDFIVTTIKIATVLALVGGTVWAGFAIYRYAKDQPVSFRRRAMAGRRRRR